MSRSLLALAVALASVVAAQAEHFVLKRSAPLTAAERDDLARRGVRVVRPVPDGYLVAGAPASTETRDLQPLTAALKLDRSAVRQLAGAAAFARLHIVFHEDISLVRARALVEAAGGTLADPLPLGFGYMHQLTAFVPSTTVAQLASDDAVFLVSSGLDLPTEPDNVKSAELSRITALHAPPYALRGSGVVLSSFESGTVMWNHPEFEGRVTPHYADGDDAHATHVAGTMIAAGLVPHGRGMAPRATLHAFQKEGGEAWQLTKDRELAPLGVVADNNSWSYIVGWVTQNGGYVWTGREELWGAYDLLRTAPVDRMARERGVLFVHSAGNDAATPSSGDWIVHRHLDAGGEIDYTKLWCQSRDGSGRDCPQPQCTSGRQYCETTPHHPLSPFDTMSVVGSAKNVIAVGSVNSEKAIANYSSRGPAKDGRVKPDLVARGDRVYSMGVGSSGIMSGTSMAAPVVTGAAALLTEQWRLTHGTDPGPDVLKALMIAGAEDLGTPGPDYTFGFGLLDAKASVDLLIRRDRVRRLALAQGDRIEIPMRVVADERVRVVLQWLDPEMTLTAADPVTAKALVNDLDLSVRDAYGATYLPYVLDRAIPDGAARVAINDTDNTEVVEFTAERTGTLTVVVNGSRIADRSPQRAVVVASAPMSVEPVAKRRSVGR